MIILCTHWKRRQGRFAGEVDTKQGVVSTPLVVDGSVYIGSRCSDLFALDAATGQVKWKFFYWSSWVESSARLFDKKVYIGSSDAQQLYSIDAASGKRNWNVNLDGSVWSSPAVTGQNVFVGVAGVVGYFIDHRGGFFSIERAMRRNPGVYARGAVRHSDHETITLPVWHRAHHEH